MRKHFNNNQKILRKSTQKMIREKYTNNDQKILRKSTTKTIYKKLKGKHSKK